MLDIVIDPFGDKLNSEVVQVFTKLDFPDKFIDEVKKTNQMTPRRNARKPATPIKLTKEELTTQHTSASQQAH